MSLWTAMILVSSAGPSAPPCAAEARAVLAALWPEAAETVAAAPADVFDTFLRCDAPDLGLRGALHESLHAVSGRGEGDRYQLVQIGGPPLSLSAIATLPASRVGSRLAHAERTTFHDAYLVGAQGEQPLTYLLDELNAYVWTLELARRLQDTRPLEGMRSSDRDGVAALEWFVVLYLDELRRRAPDEHAAVVASPEHRAAIAALFERAGTHLETTCGIPQLGLEASYWLKQVYGAEGQRVLSLVLDEVPALPEACVALVEEAPARPRKADPSAVLERNVLTRRTVRETVTITVDGEDLTLEQIEARAATDPRWQTVLEQVRAQLEEDPPAPTTP